MSKKYVTDRGEVYIHTNVTTSLLPETLLGSRSNYQYNGSTICKGNDVVEIILRPAIEYTMRQFLKVCTPEPEIILPEAWTLCTETGNFTCDSIYRYTSTCKETHSKNVNPTTSTPCTMGHVMQDDKAAIFLLVGLVFIGILLGVAATVAVCLICPNVHRWANSKIRGDICSQKKVVRASTVSSEYYAAIDEHNHANTIRLRPVQKPLPIPSPHTEPLSVASPSYSPSAVGNQNFDDPVYHSNGMSGEPIYTDASGALPANYEHLNRQNPQTQSHKYAHLETASPKAPHSPQSDCSEEAHNYFTLEKNT